MKIPLSPSSLAERWRRKKTAAAASEAASELSRHAAPVLPFRESLARFSLEITRARRYRTPLTVVTVQPRADGVYRRLMLAADGDEPPDPPREKEVPDEVRELATALLSPLLRGSVRITDIVAYDASEDDHVALFTETTRDEAEEAVDRVREVVEERFSIELRIGAAEFPDDGLTLDDLVEKARAVRPAPGAPSENGRSNGAGGS